MRISDIKRTAIAFLTATLMSVGAMGEAVTDLPVTEVKGVKCYYYDVQPRESIYQVVNKLGVTRQQIAEFNPSSVDGLKPRMRLYFPVSAFGENAAAVIAAPESDKDGASAPSDQADVATHIVKKGETLYGIANSHGVALEDLIAANPGLDPLRYKSGDTLRIPVASADEEEEDDEDDEEEENGNAPGYAAATPQGEPAPQEVGTVPAGVYVDEAAPVVLPGTSRTIVTDDDEADDEVVAAEEAEPMNVAVMLPFMLSEEAQTRTTQLYTEFFKGMLMTADTLRRDGGVPVKFTFYDTAASLDTVQALLRRPEIAEMDLVVAPDNSAQLAAIVDGVDDETLVLNIFAVKDESYRTHRNLIQTNIPHDAMYARAIDGFMRKYDGYMPVFLNRNGGQADKESFVSALKERLDAEGRRYREITFSASLGDDDLAGIDASVTPVVFVPNSGSRNEFAKFVRALTELRNDCAESSNVTVFGYPEWVTFRDESLEEICNLDATIYSRFLVDENDYHARNLKERYKELYGTEMFEAVPTQGILGFDIGMFIIEGLRQMAATGAFPAEFRGVQNTLRLGWSGGDAPADSYATPSPARGGLVNEALFFISYAPGGRVTSECL